jgi:IS30 family transposase
MIWIKRKSPIQKEVAEFAISRRRYLTTQNHVRYLLDFIKVVGIDKYEDLNELDIESYLNSVNQSVSRESERLQIGQALFLFLKFKKLQGAETFEKRGRGRPEKISRNEGMFLLRQKKYSYEEIAREYNLHKTTVFNIVKRLKDKDQKLST